MGLIVVSAIAQHLDNGMRLHASCRCGRAEWLDLSRLLELGNGDMPAAQLGERLCCRRCGRKGLDVQRSGPAFPSERAQERDRIEAEKREKARPLVRRRSPHK